MFNKRREDRMRRLDDKPQMEPSWVGPVSFIAGMAFVLLIEMFINNF